MLLHRLERDKLITPPKWLADNTHYLTVMGSNAYGVSTDASDEDIVGFAIPPREQVFPHTAGIILGFGDQGQRMKTAWQEHHVIQGAKNYDFAVYSIISFFQLCMENNPNMVDSLFTPERCIKHITPIGQMVRDERRLFLHKGSFHKFKGYAYGQLQSVKKKKNADNEKRQADIDKFGYDIKAAYHVVRLALECEQILVEGDLDLERNKEQLKAIRRGEWTLERVETFFADKEAHLENLKDKSTLPERPDEQAIKMLLMKCLEAQYGNLSSTITVQTDVHHLLREMQAVVDRFTP